MTNQDKIRKLRSALMGEIFGQEEMIDAVLIAMLANGHVLIEGVPGLGKTQLVLKMAEFMYGHDGGGKGSYMIGEGKKKVSIFRDTFDSSLPVQMVQFIPDMQPSDLIGGISPEVGQDGRFKDLTMKCGKIFTHIFIADEINRAPSKVQAALLQVMQNKKVNMIEEETARDVNKFGLFSVFATQNPLEEEGTYPLSEAFLDRFLFKIHVSHPGIKALEDISVKSKRLYDDRLSRNHRFPKDLFPLFHDESAQSKTVGEFTKIGKNLFEQVQDMLTQINGDVNEKDQSNGNNRIIVPKYILNYARDIVHATYKDEYRGGKNSAHRSSIYDYIRMPVSPRALESLITASRAKAFLSGRNYVTHSDIQEMAYLALPHRIRLSLEAMGKRDGKRSLERYVVDEILNNVPISDSSE